MIRLLALALMSLVTGMAQTATPQSTITATGQSSVFVTPDRVRVDATVVTQGNTAQAAASANASQVAGVVAALNKLLSQGADIKTIDYAVGPVYKYPSGGGQPVISGYSASMTVETTLNDITMAGAVVDAAIQGGATSIGSLQFSLSNADPSRQQALRNAAVQASSHASAMAAALGRSVGAIISLQETTPGNVVPIVTGVSNSPNSPTTITPGLIQIQATVVLQAQLN